MKQNTKPQLSVEQKILCKMTKKEMQEEKEAVWGHNKAQEPMENNTTETQLRASESSNTSTFSRRSSYEAYRRKLNSFDGTNEDDNEDGEAIHGKAVNIIRDDKLVEDGCIDPPKSDSVLLPEDCSVDEDAEGRRKVIWEEKVRSSIHGDRRVRVVRTRNGQHRRKSTGSNSSDGFHPATSPRSDQNRVEACPEDDQDTHLGHGSDVRDIETGNSARGTSPATNSGRGDIIATAYLVDASIEGDRNVPNSTRTLETVTTSDNHRLEDSLHSFEPAASVSCQNRARAQSSFHEDDAATVTTVDAAVVVAKQIPRYTRCMQDHFILIVCAVMLFLATVATLVVLWLSGFWGAEVVPSSNTGDGTQISVSGSGSTVSFSENEICVLGAQLPSCSMMTDQDVTALDRDEEQIVASIREILDQTLHSLAQEVGLTDNAETYFSNETANSTTVRVASEAGMAARHWILHHDDRLLCALDTPLCTSPTVDADDWKRGIAQRFGLASLYFATQGDQWISEREEEDRLFLTSGNHECDWIGVDCNTDTMLVKRIRLNGRQLTGQLPKEIAVLSSLEDLQASDNFIAGTIPPDLGLLPYLQKLDLSRNSIAGSLPTELFQIHSDASSPLKVLNLGDNLLEGTLPESIQHLTKLTQLDLRRNRFGGALPSESLTPLIAVETLILTDNAFTNTVPTELGDLKSLEFVRLDDNLFHGSIPESFANLENLEVLSVQRNLLEGIIDDEICSLMRNDMGMLVQLNANCGDDALNPLECSCCQCFDGMGGRFAVEAQCRVDESDESREDKGSVELFNATSENEGRFFAEQYEYDQERYNQTMKEIITEVSGSEALDDRSSAQFKAMEWLLNAGHTGMTYTSTLQRYILAVLYFATGGHDAWLCSALPGSQCGSGQFSEKVPFLSQQSECDWAGITCNPVGKITIIHIVDNGLTGRLPIRELSALSCAQVLSFPVNNILGADNEEFFLKLSASLATFDVCDNAISGPIPRVFYEMTNLASFRLSGNQYTGTVSSEIGNLSRLTELLLADNNLEGAIPIEIGKLENLEAVMLDRTDLTGKIPDEICYNLFERGGYIEELRADCDEVECCNS